MDYISVLQDSIETSCKIKIFKTIKESTFAHIFKSKICKFPLSKFTDVNNFDKNRLQDSAAKSFPLNNRPRGLDDIKSVKYHQNQIKNKTISPIWIVFKNNKYILIDGVHRIVASYIEKEKYILAYLITI